MKDVLGKHRVRHCTSVKSEGDAFDCCFECDRDESATLNMMNCFKEYFYNNSWPSHLKRKKINNLDARLLKIQKSTNMV